jgi:hypothetical protein
MAAKEDLAATVDLAAKEDSEDSEDLVAVDREVVEVVVREVDHNLQNHNPIPKIGNNLMVPHLIPLCIVRKLNFQNLHHK